MRTLFEYHIPFVVYKSERQMPYGTSKWYKPFQIQKSTDDVVNLNLLFENDHPKHEVAMQADLTSFKTMHSESAHFTDRKQNLS